MTLPTTKGPFEELFGVELSALVCIEDIEHVEEVPDPDSAGDCAAEARIVQPLHVSWVIEESLELLLVNRSRT